MAAAALAAAAGLIAGCGSTLRASSPSRPRPASAQAAPAQPASAARARISHRTTIVVNGRRAGAVFQGIGAISAGGNSRLLIDYPAPERAQILDYLFTPHFGASLQMLKLEIGGGDNSSDGSEPSVEPVRGQLSCAAGYEFWLAQ